MPTPPSREDLCQQVVLLHRDRMSKRAIARALGISRNTVIGILRRHRKARSEPHVALPSPKTRAPRASKLDEHRDKVRTLLETYVAPPITAQRVFEELRDAGFDGHYDIVKRYIRKVRPPRKPKPSMPVEPCGPGEIAECDWSPYTLRFLQGPRTIQAFCYTLRFSHRKVFRFYPSSDLHALMDGHVEAFTTLQGVARCCKYDSQKAVVLRWEGRQAILNLRFVDFSTHYESRVVACRPGHPDDKPGVERSFWELERSFLNGRSFRDDDDLRAQLAHWQTTVCDARRHRKDRKTPLELFEIERPHLRPLPGHPYDTARVAYRVCDIEGFASWKGNRYSLPFEHVTDLLPVRVTQTAIFIYGRDLACIAQHELQPSGAGKDVICPAHRPPAARHGADVDQLRQAFSDLGDEARRFFEGVVAAQHRSAAYHGRNILAMRERYDSADLVRALIHAAAFGAFDYRSVERILLAQAKPRRLDEYIAEATAKRLADVLGENGTAPRELSEYDRLPGRAPSDTERREPPCPENPQQKAPPPEPPTTGPSENDSSPISDDLA